MEYQRIFIQIISTHLPEDVKLVDFISDLIHIGKEASYRRIRCEVEFSLSEIAIISKRLNINLNSLIISEGGLKTVINLRLLDENASFQQYIKRKKGDLYLLEGFYTGKCFMYNANCTIPDEMTYEFSNLTRFKFMKMQYETNETLHPALESTTIPQNILDIQQLYLERLSTIKLIYFLDPSLFLPTIRDILFFSRLNLITEKEKKHLKEDLIQVLEIINEISTTGKFKSKEISVYVSHVSFPVSSHIYIKDSGLEASIVELNSPNSLLSFDEKMCKTHETRISLMKRYSTLITLSGEIDKAAFMKQQKEYIDLL